MNRRAFVGALAALVAAPKVIAKALTQRPKPQIDSRERDAAFVRGIDPNEDIMVRARVKIEEGSFVHFDGTDEYGVRWVVPNTSMDDKIDAVTLGNVGARYYGSARVRGMVSVRVA